MVHRKIRYMLLNLGLSLGLSLSFFSAQIVSTQIVFAQEATQEVESAEERTAVSKGKLVIGSKEYTEQLLLGQMLVELLREAGYEVEDRTGIGGSPVVRSALISGEIDLYIELTGTALSVYHDIPTPALPANPNRAYELAKRLDVPNGIIWLDRGDFNNAYTLMVRQDLIGQGITTIEELALYMNENDSPLGICVEAEFYGRQQDGLQGLEAAYGFQFQPENVQVMEFDQIYEALRDERCDIGEGFATDGRIGTWGFINLADTLNFFPFYNPAPVIRKSVLDQHPELAELLNQVGKYLDTETMSQLNARVDIGQDGLLGSGDEERVVDVARDFLMQSKLVKPPPLTVGSKEHTEQLLMGQMAILLLEDAGFDVIDRTGIGGSLVVRTALLNGEIDLYMELTGTALSVYHNIPTTALPTDPDRTLELARTLDLAQGLAWLERGEFNNTYTLMVRQETVESGIATIDDLAAYMNANDSLLTLCVESEFYGRLKDGLQGMEERYGFAFKTENILVMAFDEIYDALRDGRCDVGEGFATDGRIDAWGFTNLADTRHFFPFYNPAPVVRQEILKAHPQVGRVLTPLGRYLNNETMSLLNALVDIGPDGQMDSGDEQDVRTVAQQFLEVVGLTTSSSLAADTAEKAQIQDVLDSVSQEGSRGKLTALTIGSKADTEQRILGQLMVNLLSDAGYNVIDKTGLGTTQEVREALENGDIDLYPELTGIALTRYHGIDPSAHPDDPARSFALAKSLDAPLGLVWLTPGTYNNSYTLLVNDALVDEGILTIQDLANTMNENDAPYSICVEAEFYDHPRDGLHGLEAYYNFAFKTEHIQLMAREEIYDALQASQCDIAEGFATDSRIDTLGFTALTDNRDFFPLYVPAPVTRREVLERYPEIETLLNQLGQHLDGPSMNELNRRVELGADGLTDSGDEEDIQSVSLSFLKGERLLKPPQITIGSNTYSEQLLIGQMLVHLLEGAGYEVINRSGYGDSATLRAALEIGEIDIYTEYADVILKEVHEIPNDAIPKDADRAISLVRRLDQSSGISWLHFPDYSAVPVLRQETLEANPVLTELMAALGGHINYVQISKLNTLVEMGLDGKFNSGDEQTPDEVIYEFMVKAKLLGGPEITVGSKEYTEQLVLGQILVLMLEEAGFNVDDQTGFGDSNTVRQALEQGKIDLYPELTGTALCVHHGLPAAALPPDADRAFTLVKSLDESLGITWLDRGYFNSAYTLMVREPLMEEGITSIEALAIYMNENDESLKLCVGPEFESSLDGGLHGLSQSYGFNFKPENILIMDVTETYNALQDGTCDVAGGFSTDGRISAWGFHVLEDPLNFFPFRTPSPIIRQEVLSAYPELAELLNPIGSYLDDAAMMSLNAMVDIGEDNIPGTGDELQPRDVAQIFLCEAGLISDACDES